MMSFIDADFVSLFMFVPMLDPTMLFVRIIQHVILRHDFKEVSCRVLSAQELAR